MKVIRDEGMHNENNSREFEGADHGDVGEVEVGAGAVVVVPPGEPHGFTASAGGSRQVNIHASPRFVTEWLEEESYG
jgi:mannose-6-phosphate isomerase-like protein (cupin superfamily)